jgi:hypothetical protein
MKDSNTAKYLNIFLPSLILACIALFYINDDMNEGFQPSGGSCPLLVPNTPNTTIYSIYIFRQRNPPKLIFKMIEKNDKIENLGKMGITDANNFGFNFTSTGMIKIIISNMPTDKLVNYQVYGRQSNNWTAMSCSTRDPFAIENGNNTIYKQKSNLTGRPGAIALNPPNPTIISNKTLIFTLNSNSSLTGTDASHQNANVRIDLQFQM